MTIQEDETVWSNLSSCLQKAVMIWYHDHLNDIEKTELRSDLNLWYETLKKQFQKNSAVVLKKLYNLKYICQNTLNQVSVSFYITKIFCHAVTCSQTKFSALLTAWKEIDVKMWIYISQLNVIISKLNLVTVMKNQHVNWKSMFFSLSIICKAKLKQIQASLKSFYNSYTYLQ